MNDNDIILFFKDKKTIFWNKLPKDIIEYLKNRYKDNNSTNIKESYLRILNNIEEVPKCPICGNSLQFIGHSKVDFYKQTCGNKECSNKLRKQHIEKFNLKYYGVKETWQREDCKQHCKETWKNKYGVENPYNIKEVKEKCIKNSKSKEAKQKRKNTCLERYGIENGGGSLESIKKIKEKWKHKSEENVQKINNKRKFTCLQKYGKEYYQSTNEFRKNISIKISSDKCLNKRKQTCINKYNDSTFNNQYKRNQTLKKNNSFNRSNLEDECYILLKEKYPDIKRQYRSKVYPFNCDFYIPSLDLYIEYNGSQYHNRHFFDENNEDDIKLLEELKEKANNSKRHQENKKSQYDNIIYVWTDLDVRKRNIVKQNNLNYKVFWNIDEVKEWLKIL